MWVVDLADFDAVDQLSVDVLDAFGGVDLLVNNAGIPKRRHVTALNIDTITQVMHINYLSPMRLTMALLPQMLERGSGTIVNVSSIAAPAERARRGGLRRLEGGAHGLLRSDGHGPVGDWRQGHGRLPRRDRHRSLQPAGQRHPRPAGPGRTGVGRRRRHPRPAWPPGRPRSTCPSTSSDICPSKAQDVGKFLEGTAAYLREQAAATGRRRPGGILSRGAPRRATPTRRESEAHVKIEPDAAGMSEARLERITEHFEENYVAPGKIAGCQITVVRGGHVAYHRSLGLMDRERERPMADDAIFRIFSMTKPIASIALMQLYERGMFQLTDPVHRYIPEWRTLRSARCRPTAPSPRSSPSAR